MIEMGIGLMAIGWVYSAWKACFLVGPLESVYGLGAAVAFAFIGRQASRDGSLAWLYGWEDDVVTRTIRFCLVASVLVSPAIRHFLVWLNVFSQPLNFYINGFVAFIWGATVCIFTESEENYRRRYSRKSVDR